MPSSTPFLSLKDTHAPIAEKLYECAKRVIDSGTYINGPECEGFASELTAKLGLGSVVPVSNGLDAIRLILKGYIEMGRLKKGDEVIIPANTYIATVLPVVEFGLTPILAKPDLTTYGLDWKEVEKLTNEKTGAIITVHLYGTPSWDFESAERLKKQGILIIEDNAQAIGATVTNPATRQEISTGALADASAFSFYPTKNVGAFGDAGAAATNDRQLAGTIKALANYGSTRRYYNEYIGFNCRMDEIQAAFLRLKLQTLEETALKRDEKARLYDRLINNPTVTLPTRHPHMRQVWHQYVVRTPRREELIETLAAEGIATDIHYPLSLFDQPCFKNAETALKQNREAVESAKKLAKEVVSLPIANITNKEIEKIAGIINRI